MNAAKRASTIEMKTNRLPAPAASMALETERRIDRGESVSAKRPRNLSTFGDLVDLHIADMHEIKKLLQQSKAYSLQNQKKASW